MCARECMLMLSEQRKILGDRNRHTINLMRKVARMLIEQTIGGASEGATRAANLTEAKEYIDIALQHALDKDWSKRKLEPLLAMYEAAVAKVQNMEVEDAGPPKKKQKRSVV